MYPQQQIQVILSEIDYTIFYTNLHELFCQFISWTHLVNFGKLLNIMSYQAMAYLRKAVVNHKNKQYQYYCNFQPVNGVSFERNQFGRLFLGCCNFRFHEIFVFRGFSFSALTSGAIAPRSQCRLFFSRKIRQNIVVTHIWVFPSVILSISNVID